MNAEQRARAQLFISLHKAQEALVILNVWDAASARIFELAGAKAIATTSGGLAMANGYPDGQKMPRAMLVAAVERITRVVSIPVSVDLEAGFGATASEAAESVEAIAGAGAIGINIEDGSDSPALLAEKIAAIRSRFPRGEFFINARTDVYLRGLVEPPQRFDESIRRIREYAAAGADGAFVPGIVDAETIGRFARELPLPLNVLVHPGMPSVGELHALGVARVSIGGGCTYAAMSLARRVAEEILVHGTYQIMFAENRVNYGEANRMFSKIR